ncbi:MAG: hypothetical protein K2F81_06715 [Ruminococcus sp.]|nr:hypothetical protein [Ruminococcus sp.]
MKKTILAILLFSILTFLGCRNDKTDKNIVDSDLEMANKIVNKTFNQEEYIYTLLPQTMLQIKSHIPSIDDIKNLIGLECLRHNDKLTYSIHKFKNQDAQEGYCFISYDEEQVVDCWFVVKVPDKKQFLNLKVNINSFNDIKKLDSAATLYEFDTPCSIHRFKDGSMITIYYEKTDNEYIIKNFDWTDDPAHIVENILPIDLELIE